MKATNFRPSEYVHAWGLHSRAMARSPKGYRESWQTVTLAFARMVSFDAKAAC